MYFKRKVSEIEISKAIISESLKYLQEIVDVDVVIVGAGPSGMSCAYYLAKNGLKVVVLERRLSFGGGIGGGGMLLPRIVVESPVDEILVEDFGVNIKRVSNGLYVIDPPELIAKLAVNVINAGGKILLGISVEDVIYRDNPTRITGVVINWTAVQISGLWVDPLFIQAKAVVDATGHEAAVLNIVKKKLPEVRIEVPGEKSAYSEIAEELVVEKSGKVIPGLYVVGMATASLYGLPRMGPLFGAMILSGKKVAEEIIKDLKSG